MHNSSAVQQLPVGIQSGAEHASQRRNRRATLRTAIDLRSASNLYTGFTQNVSSGGVFVATHHIVPIGSHIELELSFAEAGGPVIQATGEVRWVREESSGAEPGMGLRFVKLSEEHQRWLDQFVKRRDPLFFDADAMSAGTPCERCIESRGGYSRNSPDSHGPPVGVGWPSFQLNSLWRVGVKDRKGSAPSQLCSIRREAGSFLGRRRCRTRSSTLVAAGDSLESGLHCVR